MNPRAKTSMYRGVHWDRHHQCWATEIEVRGIRFKLGRFKNEVDAMRAYDIACEHFDVPERRNFGAHESYRYEQRVRACWKCKGLGLIGGEYQRATGTNLHMKFIAGFSQLRDCPHCAGAGYFLQDTIVFAASEAA